MNKFLKAALIISIASTICSTELSAQAKKLTDLYTNFETLPGYPTIKIEPTIIENSALYIDIVKDHKAMADGKSDDSAALQSAINAATADKNGGVVYLPKGEYLLQNIVLKSNVHLHIEAGTKIYLPSPEGKGNNFLFGMGYKGSPLIDNVVIKGVNGRFSIHLAEGVKAPRTFILQNVHNFLISDVDVYDHKIEYPIISLICNYDKDEEIFGPTDGVIKNASSFNCHYGYGLVQIWTAKRVFFENLFSQGGVTLRFETGANFNNNNQFGGAFDCRGLNIRGENGNSTVMVSPHALHNGIVQIKDVYSEASGFGARIEGGYVAKGYKAADGVRLTDGTYTKGGYIENVTSTFGRHAQLKSKHFYYMPESLLKEVGENTYKTIYEPSPSIAPVLCDINFDFGCEGEIVGIGFTELEKAQKRMPKCFMNGQRFVVMESINSYKLPAGENQKVGQKGSKK
ncbi:MAG: glycosyl hydrolase family 28-related protein [Rikenellaceae bacterium]